MVLKASLHMILSIVKFFLKPWANALELVEPRQEDYA
jgi:hypothetical protein